MSEPLPLPLRVLVKGASTVHTVSWMGGPRRDFAYPRATEAQLYAAGVPAEVRCTAMASQRVKTALKNWEVETFSWSPDVVVLNYGHFETVHFLLPQRLERHAHSMADRPGPIRTPYRIVLRKFWKLLARIQQQLDRRLPSTMLRNRPRRVENDLVRLIERIQMIGSPLVLVMELTPPGAPFRNWFPGMGERMEVMNQALREVVRRTDKPNVRFFETNTVLAPLMQGDEEVNPDGGHYTPEAHRAIAERLAEEILEFARQEGLTKAELPDDPAHRITAVPD
ncbi:MAG TPA: SGNH/GDSL hydrolase family protein [Nocardioides sp.]|nr:SGNH/GDSL hydrolase family protein [Nocardioides sp.]